MAALQFPLNPTVNQVFVGSNGINYTWDGIKWVGKGQLGAPPQPPQYVLPPATPVQLGGVEIGSGLTIDNAGVLSAKQATVSDNPPENPAVGTLWFDSLNNLLYVYQVQGWEKVGGVDLLNVNSNIIPTTDNIYNLGSPTKQWHSLYVGPGSVYIGGIQLTNASGNLTINGASGLTLPRNVTYVNGAGTTVPLVNDKATTTSLGVVQVGSNINVNDGILSVPTATNNGLGVVKAGSNVTIDGTGAVNVPRGAGINTLETIANVNPAGITDGSLLVYNQTASRWDVTVNLTQENWDSGQY
jgi:hypothetical protein